MRPSAPWPGLCIAICLLFPLAQPLVAAGSLLETLRLRVPGLAGKPALAELSLEVQAASSGEALRPLSRRHRRFLLAAELSGQGWTILGPRGSAAAPAALSRSLSALTGGSLRAAELLPGDASRFRSAAGSSFRLRGWTEAALSIDASFLAPLGRDALCTLPPLPPEAGTGATSCCLILEGSSGSEAWVFSLSREFFPGEWAFLSTAAGADPRYGKRAIALLGTFFERTGPHWAPFRSCMEGLGWKLSAAEWAAFEGKPGLQEAKAELAAAMRRSLGPGQETSPSRVLAGSMDARVIQAALFRPGSGGFQALWGREHNPYVEAWLAWHFALAKPLLSRESHAILQAAGIGDSNWEGARPLTAAEGLELGRAALRFLCWGVEYSSVAFPFSDMASLQRLWAQDALSPLPTGSLKAWATQLPAAGAGRGENYFPFAAGAGQASLALHDTTGRLAARPSRTLEIPASAPVLRGFRQIARSGGQAWPLPYAEGGVDSPRSFAAKMALQLGSRQAMAQAALKAGASLSLKKTLDPYIPPAASTAGSRMLPAPRLGSAESFASYAAWLGPGGSMAPWRLMLGADPEGSGIKAPWATEPLRPFLPGQGALAESWGDGSGVDAAGLLCAALSMTGMAEFFMAYDGSSRPAQARDAYERSLPAAALPAYEPGKTLADINAGLGISLSPADLERSSLLLPDISLLREGDIVMSGGLAGEPLRLGIVVYAPSAGRPARGEDPLPWLASVIVVGAVRERGRVGLACLDFSPTGPWNGLCPGPAELQFRRLILRSGPAPGPYPAAEWDFLRERAEGLWVDLSFKERWIPNTGQFLSIDAIRFDGAVDGRPNGFLMGRSGTNNTVVPSGALDRHYGQDHWASTNSPGSAFALWAFDADPERVEGIPLVALLSDGKGGYRALSEAQGFLSAVYSAELDPGPGWTSRADEEGRFTVEGFGRVFRRFGIRPLWPGSAAPGDDILLSFRLVMGDTVLEGRAPPGQYLAAYDRKLLWRANLYVDEGSGDWNDLHPWNAPASAEATAEKKPWWWSPAWGYNAWNMYRTEAEEVPSWTSTGADPGTPAAARGLDASCRALLPSGSKAPIPGGQVVRFPPWTSWNQIPQQGSSTSYSWAGEDSPFEFVEELLEQGKATRARREADLANPSAMASSLLAIPWKGSGPPAEAWDNYLFPRRRLVSVGNPAGLTYAYDGKESPTVARASQHPWTLSPGGLASVPGLTTFLAFCKLLPPARNPGNPALSPAVSGMDGTFYPDWQTPYSSGLDCSGFVWRALIWEGNPYAVTWRPAVGKGDGFDSPSFSREILPPTSDTIGTFTGLSDTIPGDILLWKGSHIAIVQDVEMDPLGEAGNKQRVRVIHAGSGKGMNYQVFINTQWFGENEDLINDASYALKRLVHAAR